MTSSSPKTPGNADTTFSIDGIRRNDNNNHGGRTRIFTASNASATTNRNHQTPGSNNAPAASRNLQSNYRNQVRTFFRDWNENQQNQQQHQKTNNIVNVSSDEGNTQEQYLTEREEVMRKSIESRDKELQDMNDLLADQRIEHVKQMQDLKKKLNKLEKDLEKEISGREREQARNNSMMYNELMADLKQKEAQLRDKQIELMEKQALLDQQAAVAQYTQYRTALADSFLSLNQTDNANYNAPPVLPFIQPRTNNLTSTTIAGATATNTGKTAAGATASTEETANGDGTSAATGGTQTRDNAQSHSETISNSMMNNFNNIHLEPDPVADQNLQHAATVSDPSDEIHLSPEKTKEEVRKQKEMNQTELQKILNRSRQDRQNPFASTDENESDNEIYFESTQPVAEFDLEMQENLNNLRPGGQTTLGALARIYGWFRTIQSMNIDDAETPTDSSSVTEEERKRIDSLAIVLLHLAKVISGDHHQIEAKVEASRMGKEIYKKWKFFESKTKRKYTGVRRTMFRERMNSFREAGFADDSGAHTTTDSPGKSDTLPEKSSGTNPFEEDDNQGEPT